MRFKHWIFSWVVSTAGAEQQFNHALAELKDYPAPLVASRVHASMARLKSQSGDAAGSQEHSTHAQEIVNSIAANVADEKLRAGSSPPPMP
jgi:hypothetical protein